MAIIDPKNSTISSGMSPTTIPCAELNSFGFFDTWTTSACFATTHAPGPCGSGLSSGTGGSSKNCIGAERISSRRASITPAGRTQNSPTSGLSTSWMMSVMAQR